MDSQPDDLATLKAELALARARNADDAATIARQKLEIAKLKRQIYGARSERTARLLDQMELDLEDLEAAATEDEIAAEQAAIKTTTVAAFTRKRPSRTGIKTVLATLVTLRIAEPVSFRIKQCVEGILNRAAHDPIQVPLDPLLADLDDVAQPA